MWKVSLDGGGTFIEGPTAVLLVWEDVVVPGEDGRDGELHVKATAEGLVVDVWASKEEPGALDHNAGTSSETVDEIVERLTND